VIRNTIRRTRAIIVKEFKHILFDPGFLFLTILSPAVLLTLLAYVFSFDVDKANIAIYNRDGSPQAREYIRALTADGDLTIVANVDNANEFAELFRAGAADGGVVIPPDFGMRLSAGEQAEVNLVVDGSDTGTAHQVIRSIDGRSQSYAASLAGSAPPPFDLRVRIWFNENLRSQVSMIPGLMALVLILPAMALALTVARERESGTFETLVTTPVAGREYLLGKLVVYLSLGVVGGLLALAVAVFWFRVPFRGDLGMYALMIGDYLFATMAFCLLLTNFVHSQRAVSNIVLLLLFIPGFFLTGLILPIDRSSIVSVILAFCMPGTHFMIISRSIALKGVEMISYGFEAATLLGMGLIGVIGALVTFNKKM
jgi:ABC-2 type transport system permease protein